MWNLRASTGLQWATAGPDFKTSPWCIEHELRLWIIIVWKDCCQWTFKRHIRNVSSRFRFFVSFPATIDHSQELRRPFSWYIVQLCAVPTMTFWFLASPYESFRTTTNEIEHLHFFFPQGVKNKRSKIEVHKSHVFSLYTQTLKARHRQTGIQAPIWERSSTGSATVRSVILASSHRSSSSVGLHIVSAAVWETVISFIIFWEPSMGTLVLSLFFLLQMENIIYICIHSTVCTSLNQLYGFADQLKTCSFPFAGSRIPIWSQ